jgi:hypothetical protein
MSYCIGGCFAGKLMQRAPDRVVAAVYCQTVGHRAEDPTVMYRHSKENWVPDFMKRRPDVSTDAIENCLHNLYAVQPDFLYSVSRDFIRACRMTYHRIRCRPRWMSPRWRRTPRSRCFRGRSRRS